MLKKSPRSGFDTLKKYFNTSLKAVFLVEAAAFAVSFGVWYRLNTNRDFRLYMYKNHSWVLESYYTLGEKIADQKTREFDLKVWNNEGQI